MITDTFQEGTKYSGLHPLFRQAFEFLLSVDIRQLVVGKNTVADGLTAIYQRHPGISKEQSCAEFECHNDHIDIQVCLSGSETFGWKPRGDCKQPNGPFTPEKDLQLFLDEPDTFFQLHPGQFVIFFPEDVHAPGISAGEIHKIVMKVKI